MLQLQLSGGQVADDLNIYCQRVILVGELVYDPNSVAVASSFSLGSVIIFLSTGYISSVTFKVPDKMIFTLGSSLIKNCKILPNWQTSFCFELF